jgi:hypothetical protein
LPGRHGFEGQRLMKTKGAFCFSLCLALVAFTPGCSVDENHASVTGTVTLDGQPLKSGTIRFDSTDGRAAAADASITDGRFTAKMPPGDKRVSITAPKVVGKRKMYDTPDSPTVDTIEELLPARYNSQSTLTLTVAPGGQQPTFELKSGK